MASGSPTGNAGPVTQWWLDELAYAGEEHLDPDYVASYDRKAGFDPTDDLDALVRYGLGPDSTVVDLGSGTGVFSIAAAPLCRQVMAVDVSPPMCDALRTRVDELGIENITVVRAGFLSYQHRDPPADFVFSRNALHQLPDFWKGIALQRIASLLRPDGILRLRDLVFDFDPVDADERITAWMSGAVPDATAGWTADELAHHVRKEFSTYSWLLDAMLRRTGFEILDRQFRRSAYGVYTCRNRAQDWEEKGGPTSRMS
jgi:SAM-dependent methyltransferase